ncbi:hypothetical protein I8748_14810 [Nostoc sp. CENA67]|uniref:Uncharacterized protein n=1 Tax=Amazonocrinis nigriterrae CENA67 TaxID=2794033 RepID=A0A8J7HVM0_9NOST|nr:hypothetical protein [Amazonocrinis nigriterrae]MBH8563439.1 hypothetical protein [Amazonocrinis nigriterrae CENA67]
MTEPRELTATDAIAAQELTDIIAELEEYRERLVNDTLAIAQRAKILKSQALAQLEPYLNEIDAKIQELRTHQAALITNN